jgi:hypothetical protein
MKILKTARYEKVAIGEVPVEDVYQLEDPGTGKMLQQPKEVFETAVKRFGVANQYAMTQQVFPDSKRVFTLRVENGSPAVKVNKID